jgi:hypothetical protein
MVAKVTKHYVHRTAIRREAAPGWPVGHVSGNFSLLPADSRFWQQQLAQFAQQCSIQQSVQSM